MGKHVPGSAHRGLRTFATVFAVWYLRAAAVVNLLGAIWLSFGRGLERHNAGDLFTPHLVAPGCTGALFAAVLAVAMRRRRRAAWIVNLYLGVVVLLLHSAVLIALPGPRAHPFNWVSCALTALFVAALVAGRRAFRVRGDRVTRRPALAVALGGLVLAAVPAALLVSAVSARAPAGHRADPAGWTVYALERLFLLDGTGVRVGGVALPHGIGVLVDAAAALLLLLAVPVAFRVRRASASASASAAAPMSARDEERLRALLERHGERDSLGYFATRRDKSVVWSPSGKAAVTYRVLGGVSLASADPLGDPEAWPGAIEAWLTECAERAWAPAVIGAGETAGTVYARHGLAALELGDEALVETAGFTLEGRAMRNVRQAYNRALRAGYTARIRRHADIPREEMNGLRRRADQWRHGGAERGFSMALGRLGDPRDGRCVMVECRDGEGALRALLSFVPWGSRGLSLDVMRRDREAENGLMEFCVLELILRAREVGVTRVSLNFAMFRSVFERGARLGAGPVLRLWRALLVFFSHWWQLESLYRANAKYRPVWEPRFVLYARSSQLPRAGLACARAEGFLGLPFPSRVPFPSPRPSPARLPSFLSRRALR